MRSLLDINVIIALLDPDHTFHEKAHSWWAQHHDEGWASCPLTENGTVRIMSNSSYSREMQFTPHELINQLRLFGEQTDHEFWGIRFLLGMRRFSRVISFSIHGN